MERLLKWDEALQTSLYCKERNLWIRIPVKSGSIYMLTLSILVPPVAHSGVSLHLKTWLNSYRHYLPLCWPSASRSWTTRRCGIWTTWQPRWKITSWPALWKKCCTSRCVVSVIAHIFARFGDSFAQHYWTNSDTSITCNGIDVINLNPWWGVERRAI